ncbi:ABC transporter permease [Abyssalbus ytuae]|uniref:ABC transporter permease n=1 Tax=Abyssalbus ytuae TaxID=2926907 RepID=A0A9E6ZY77_9FLAO|nr:ABC transporter permease [Abyssalbus ytuae]UOB16071.1 ABC transporter permease [Abyssalbus ytuae]
MLRNYFKIAWRNLIRNKSFSFLNIAGLSIGIAAAALILLWINFELGFDQFHQNKDRIYEVYNKYETEGKISCWNSTPKIMAKMIRQDFPEVESVVRTGWSYNFLFSSGEKRIKSTGTVVDKDFLDVFSFPLIKGNPETVFKEVNSVVITEKLAKKLFENENPLDKVVKIDDSDHFTVTGVLKDLPSNTTFDFEYLIPWSYLKQKGWEDEYWGNNSIFTYVMLKDGVSNASFAPKIKNLREKYDKESPRMETFLYPFSRSYLYSRFENGEESGGRIEIIRIFGFIAAFILLIACINFMNLSTARSEKRAKEVGVRKVVGAEKKYIIGQFLGESVFISFFAAVIALIIILIVLPLFNNLIERQLSIDFTNPWFWITGIGIILFTGVLAGSYPALYLSAFKPVVVLKGTFKKINTLITPRKVLVVVQFTFAIILIISTVVIRQQLKKAQNRQLGYSKDNLIYTFIEGEIEKNYPLIKEELLSSGIATSITKTSAPITECWSNSWGFEWKGKPENDRTTIDRFIADEAIIKTTGLELIQGRDFNLSDYPTDSTAVILNESAVNLMKFKNPLGQIIKDNGTDWHVVGVIKDFVMRSPFESVKPMVIEGAKAWFEVIHIKLSDLKSTSENLAAAEKVFKKYNPEYPFNFRFVDSEYAKKFNNEKRTGKLAGLFTMLTIIISCLGLFGLASYMAENRIKEIGIRKVLGASVSNITALLSAEFIKLVAIAFVIASPIAWYSMNKWLNNYAYQVKISWLFFAAAGILAILIALITVSFQAIKAAIANPVKSLKTE